MTLKTVMATFILLVVEKCLSIKNEHTRKDHEVFYPNNEQYIYVNIENLLIKSIVMRSRDIRSITVNMSETFLLPCIRLPARTANNHSNDNSNNS